MKKEVIVSSEIDSEIIKNIENLGVKVYKTKNNKNLLSPLQAHPDMLIHILPNGNIVADRDNYDYYKKLWPDRIVFKSEKSLNAKYPQDISLNGVAFKNYFIHNLEHTDKTLYEYYKNKGYDLINVKQGYTKCNITLGKNVLITSDSDIYNKLNNKVKILLIDHKQIILKGFNYGFIGGASGYFNDKIYFTGNLKKHSSFNKIIKFLNENNEEYDFLSKKEIEDFGSILKIT